MGFRGHGSLFLNNAFTPLGLDRGTWGLGDMGGEMGTRGHGV